MSPQPAKKPDEKPDDKPPEVTEEDRVEPGVVPTDEQQAKAAEGVPTDTSGEQVADKPAYPHDPHDVGVPQNAGKRHAGPDDAFDPVTNSDGEPRADYSARVSGQGPSYRPEPIPEGERVPGGPTTRMVPQVPAT